MQAKKINWCALCLNNRVFEMISPLSILVEFYNCKLKEVIKYMETLVLRIWKKGAMMCFSYRNIINSPEIGSCWNERIADFPYFWYDKCL